MHLRLAIAAAALALAGCASMNTVTSEVASYGSWPVDRSPGTYAIERLPSQQVRGAQQEGLESGARSALEEAGFQPAANAAQADVMVQIGARASRTDYVPWDDPLWWRWGPAYWRRPGYYWRPGWGWPPSYESQYDQEVGCCSATARPAPRCTRPGRPVPRFHSPPPKCSLPCSRPR